MDINWSLLGNLPDIGGNAVKAYDAGRQQAYTKSVAQKAATGDYAGAQTEAGNFGDLNAVEHFQTQQQAQQDRAHTLDVRKYETGAAAAFALANTPVEQRGALFQTLSGRLKASGWTDEDLSHVQLNNDQYLHGLAAQGMSMADQLKQQNEDRTFNLNAQKQAFDQAQPKDIVGPDGSVYTRQPVQPGSVPGVSGFAVGGQAPGGAPTQPGLGGGVPSTGPVSREAFGNAIAMQESHNNYTARNASTGAMGKYQVMPATGRVLAQRLGLPWNPSLMLQDTPQARQYQDAIGGAAIDEAYKAGNGDINTAAMYYHGGSNRDIWGPKTQQYARDINQKLGGATSQPQSGAGQAVGGGLTKVIEGRGFDRWTPATQNGLTGQVNQKTGEFKADPGQATAPKQLTEDQRKTSGYAARMAQAEQDIQDVSKSGYNRASITGGIEAALGDIPYIGNIIQPGDAQRQRQAERNFINASLRRESGATISPSEFDNAEKQYFPRVGDKQDVLDQKKRNRDLQIKSFQDQSSNTPNGNNTQIHNAADYARLPSGTSYIDPQGQRRTKP